MPGSAMSSKSKIKTELDFLAALESGEVVTQMTLAGRVEVAVGLINALLKRAIHKGYVKAKAAPCKRYAYYLTPSGFSEKSRLVAEYLEVSLAFFRDARQQYGELCVRARMAGVRQVVLVGGGELAEIALLAAREHEIEVVGILDRETNRDRLFGVPVLRDCGAMAPGQGVIITASRHPQAAFEQLRGRFAESRILVPALLRVTRASFDAASEVAA